VDAAAWGVVAEIGSSKQMAGVSAVSGKFAEILRLLWLQGEARSAGAGARHSAVSEFALMASCRGFLSKP
jgi:hypothetical protein